MTKLEPIKAVLFDFGGVFTLSPFSAVELLARERAIDPGVFAELVFGPYHLDTDHPWHKLERGEITLEQTRGDILQLATAAGHEIDLWDVLLKMGSAHGGKVVNQPMVDLLREVKQAGYQTAIVTNNVKEFSSHWQSLIPIELVDVVVDSAFEGVRKPAPAIYQRTLKRLAALHGQPLMPGECLFLDDVQSNVQAAENQGMHALQVGADIEKAIIDTWARLSPGRV